MSYDHIQVNTQSSIRIEGSKVVYKAEQQSTTSIGASAPHGCG